MKEINVQEKDSDIQEFVKLLNRVLEVGEYNLDRCVAGDIFSVADSPLKNESEIINKLWMLLPKVVDKKGEEYIGTLLQSIDAAADNVEFSKWLSDFAVNLYKIYKRADSLRELSLEDFKTAVSAGIEYAFVHKIGEEGIEENTDIPDVYKENHRILNTILFNYFDSIICKNKSKYNVDTRFQYLWGLEQEHNDILWEGYRQNEMMLWNRFMMQKIANIEKIFESIMESDET